MLKQRILTALVLVPLMVTAVLLTNPPVFALIIAVIVLLGAWEWALLCGIKNQLGRLGYVVSLGFLLMLWWFFATNPKILWAALTLALGWWLLTLITLKNISLAPRIGFDFAGLMVGPLVLGVSWASLVALFDTSPNGPIHIVLLLFLIWATDSGAYFAGRRWGRARLAPRISPGKTWEGVYGGLVAALITALVGSAFLDLSFSALLAFVVVCELTAAFSILGDLTESVMKRRSELKNSGRLFPGHGGMMDRIDSLTAASPFYVAGIMLVSELFG